jgi:RHS repeat-associated protein
VFGNLLAQEVYRGATGQTSVTRYARQEAGLSEEALSQAGGGDRLGGRTGPGDGSGSSSGLATGGVAPVWAELDGSNRIQARYLSKDALDAVFARLAVGSSGGVTWNLTDRLGSVRAVMNNSGQLVNSLSYDAFGVSSVTAPGVGDRFRYAGYPYDAATGLYYVGARWYDPSQGRWLSQDPLGLAADSNPYRYVSNTPTNAVDPSGKLWSLLLNVGILAWDTFRYATGQIDRQHFLQNVALDFMFITLDVLTLGTGLGSGARGAALAVQGGRLVIRATATVQVCGAVRDAAVVTNTVYHFLEGTSLVGPRGGAMLFNSNAGGGSGSGSGESPFRETYHSLEDAIGEVNPLGRSAIIGRARTQNPRLRRAGFTETIYVRDSKGRQWTVFYNPRTGEYAGGHLSSSNF